MKFTLVLILLLSSPAFAFGLAPKHENPVNADPEESNSIHVSGGNAQYSASYSASISGEGPNGMSVNITDNVGTINFSGSDMTTFIQDVIPWSDQHTTLYQGIAFDATHWGMYWIYCDGNNQITGTYSEGFTSEQLKPGTSVLTGTCSANMNSPRRSDFTIPEMKLPPLQPVTGFTIQGNDISLTPDGVGSVNVLNANDDRNRRFNFVPFAIADCRTCGNPGWWELHSIFWNDTPDRACFGIIYLSKINGAQNARIAYSNCLPDMDAPLDSVSLPAQWSVPQQPRVVRAQQLKPKKKKKP